MLAAMVEGEIGCVSDDYFGCYCQCATAINRVKTGWGSSIEEVLWQEGQYSMDYYLSLEYISEASWNAVYECVADWASQVPESLIYADCRGTAPDGFYIYYQSWTNIGIQNFYAQ